MNGAIAERVLELVDHLAGCVGRQPLQTDGGPRDVTTQTFKTFTLLRLAGNSHVLFGIGVSLGDVFTLVYPQPWRDNLIRVSVGCEDASDIIGEFEAALLNL